MTVKPGDSVLYGKYAGTEVTVDGSSENFEQSKLMPLSLEKSSAELLKNRLFGVPNSKFGSGGWKSKLSSSLKKSWRFTFSIFNHIKMVEINF